MGMGGVCRLPCDAEVSAGGRAHGNEGRLERQGGFLLAREEAKTAVKDDGLLIEKLVQSPRHIH